MWESSLVDLLLQELENKRLIREGESTTDKWLWRGIGSTKFSVNVAYNILLGEEPIVVGDPFVEFWKLKTLPSAQVTAWRVLCNVIATKDNLMRRGIHMACARCPLCGVEEETLRHLFFECRVSWRIWGMCLEWLGFLSVLHGDAQLHFKMFKPIGLKHVIVRCWGGIWVGIVSEIWNHRNKVVFENGHVDVVEVFSFTQRKTWSWVTSMESVVNFSYSDWCLEPQCCMRYLKD